jgi:biopolymer transport protein TolQ
MFEFLSGNSLWHLITQSDAISKGVLLILLILSIISWALFFYELYVLSMKSKQLKQAIASINQLQNIEELLSIVQTLNATMPGYFLNKNLLMLKSLLETAKKNGRGLLSDERELLRDYSYQIIDELVAQEEQYLPYFSATAAVSPLLGLFGTVWGLVHAFIRISEKQSADIATVAPGIAEALITTLAGLIVAIPALVMFVYLSTRLKNLEQQFINLAERCNMIVSRLQ